MKRTSRLLALILALGLVAAACGGDDGVTVKDAWARNSAGTQNAGAGYLTIEGGSEDDRLLSASVPLTVAGMAQIHESTMTDGVMSMSQVGEIVIPAGETVMLEPGGYHVMMMNLADSLDTGESFTVTLEFEKAGTIEVDVEVREG